MPEHPTDAHFSFTFVFKQALSTFGRTNSWQNECQHYNLINHKSNFGT